jgi:hypothetical protein
LVTALKRVSFKAARGAKAFLRSRAHAIRLGRARVRPENIVWIFGSPRTGSTWLGRIIREQPDQSLWFEPYVGHLFGPFYEHSKRLHNRRDFILGEPYRKEWISAIRDFILRAATVRFPEVKREHHLFVKEPNGSLGSPLIMEAMPESKLVFLIRDSRDVVASRLDGARKGSWGRQNWEYDTPQELNAFTRRMAHQYLKNVSQVKKAYDAHPGKKTLVRYEDLTRDTFGTLKSMYEALGVRVDEAQLKAAIEKHSWERIPEEDKGSGKFFRKGQAGGWQEDLTPKQVGIVEKITAPVLDEFYPNR